MLQLKLYTPAIIWAIIIVFLSGFPGNQVPKIPVWQFDKFVHTIMYALFSILLLLPFVKYLLTNNNRFFLKIVVVVFGISFGGFMEYLQIHIFINRSGNWYDFFANSLGAILGVFIFPLLLKILPNNKL